jgi:hypothetical protein
MNVEDNVASENWEDLLSMLNDEEFSPFYLNLDDSKADRCDFANEILMRRMRERMVETLERTPNRAQFSELTFGNKFFMTMNEQQQQTFFHSIFNLPAETIDIGRATDNNAESRAAITMSTSALLETLPQLHTNVVELIVGNFALTCESDVQAVSNFILAKIETLASFGFDDIDCPVEVYTKQESDEPNGFLDPLLHAAIGLDKFWLSTKTRSVHSTLVSPTALRALLVEGYQFVKLFLCSLGLTDSHILAIVDGLSTPGIHLGCLNLSSNPGITAQGYDALFNLVNRTNVIGNCGRSGVFCQFCVDDKAWEGKLNLVSEMNSAYNRLEYMTNGSFSSEESRLQWLEWVVDLPRFYDEDEEDRCYHRCCDEVSSSYDGGGSLEEEAAFNDEDEEDSSYVGVGAIVDEAVFNDEDEEDRGYGEEDSSFDGGGAIEDEAVFNDEDEEDRSHEEEDNSSDEGGAVEVKAVWDRKIDDAKRINFIWYLLRENPEMMRTSNDMFQIL